MITIEFLIGDDLFEGAFTNIPEDGMDVQVATGTTFKIVNPNSGAIITITGTGFTYSDGTPTGGTVASMVFETEQGGSIVTYARITGASWNFADVVLAADLLDEQDDHSGFDALLNQQPITLDAASNPVGVTMTDDGESTITQSVTVTGSAFDDRLVGGISNDAITPGESAGYDQVYGTAGNDTIDYGQSLLNYQELNYGQLNRGIDVVLDAVANTASIDKGTNGTDTLIDVRNPLLSGWAEGGLGLHGTDQADSFDITMAQETWMQIRAGAGDDHFKIDVTDNSIVRIDYVTGASGPLNNGVDIDLGQGRAADDGFGGNDTYDLTIGNGRAEFRLSDMADTFVGSDDKDRVILRAGNDTADGAGGWDTLRYDRGGVEWVQVDLGAGSVTANWFGASYVDTISNFEDIRGSRTGHDTFIGDDADNRWDGMGGENFARASGGSDTYVYGNTRGYYQTLSYDTWDRGIKAVIKGDKNVGAVKKSKTEKDTLEDIQNTLREGWNDGGISLYGTARHDSFIIDGGLNTWMQVSGGAGRDDFKLTLSGTVRLNFSWDGDQGPTSGISVNVAKGKVFDDGFGTRDTLDITAGDGQLQIRGTVYEDRIIGSDIDESFILDGGGDFVDGAGGIDTLRYDRSNLDVVTVRLDKGAANATWGGTSYRDTFKNIENVRGSREGDDKLIGSNGANKIQGRGGDDLINGKGGADQLYGEAGNDRILGGGGADLIVGGTGDDDLTGNKGADVFEFALGDGNDRIRDFKSGQDVIRLAELDGMGDLTLRKANGGKNTEIFYGDAGDSILVEGMRKGQFDSSDFDFG